MKKTVVLLLLSLMIFFCACASQPAKPPIKIDEIPAASEETEAVSVPSREPVFIYGNRKDLASHLILTLTGEPVLLPSGYVRLAGVVSGRRKTVCVEIGGRGLALGEGETADDYRIVRISGDTAVLEKTK
jgi:hypothetical protein